jgi:predicted GNAT family acetyltransferase
MTSVPETSNEPTVRHDVAASRYELVVGGEVVSLVDHVDDDAGPVPVRAFTHTYTEPAVRDRGYGETVVQAALDEARAEGRLVRAACWFVREFIAEHPAYRDLLV